jgi:hypothetical protein
MAAIPPPTIEEIEEEAIVIAAYIIKWHNLPHRLPTLKRLQAYLEQRLAEGDAALSAARNGIEKYLNGDKPAGGAA